MMTFTELEYCLMLAVAVLLWRNSVLNHQLYRMTARADRYVEFLLGVHRGEGRVVEDENGFRYEPKRPTA
jgi:hypothetical protein